MERLWYTTADTRFNQARGFHFAWLYAGSPVPAGWSVNVPGGARPLPTKRHPETGVNLFPLYRIQNGANDIPHIGSLGLIYGTPPSSVPTGSTPRPAASVSSPTQQATAPEPSWSRMVLQQYLGGGQATWGAVATTSPPTMPPPASASPVMDPRAGGAPRQGADGGWPVQPLLVAAGMAALLVFVTVSRRRS